MKKSVAKIVSVALVCLLLITTGGVSAAQLTIDPQARIIVCFKDKTGQAVMLGNQSQVMTFEDSQPLISLFAVAKYLGYQAKALSNRYDEVQKVSVSSEGVQMTVTITKDGNYRDGRRLPQSLRFLYIGQDLYVSPAVITELTGLFTHYALPGGQPTLWITDFTLLPPEQIDSGDPAYRKIPQKGKDGIYYDLALVEGYRTSRYIKLGDPMTKIRGMYGIPVREERSDEYKILVYGGYFYPPGTFGYTMKFVFKDDVLVKAILQPSGDH